MYNFIRSLVSFVILFVFSLTCFAQGATLVGATTDLVLTDTNTVNTRPHTSTYGNTYLTRALCESAKAEIENSRPVVIGVNSADKLINLYGTKYSSWARISTLKCQDFSE